MLLRDTKWLVNGFHIYFETNNQTREGKRTGVSIIAFAFDSPPPSKKRALEQEWERKRVFSWTHQLYLRWLHYTTPEDPGESLAVFKLPYTQGPLWTNYQLRVLDPIRSTSEPFLRHISTRMKAWCLIHAHQVSNEHCQAPWGLSCSASSSGT